MPRGGIHHELPRRVHWPSFIKLKVRWRSSLKALLRRAADLGTINDNQYKRGMIEYNKYGWNDGEPGDEELGELESPLLIYKALEVLKEKRGVDLAEFGKLLRVDHERLEEIVPRRVDKKLDLAL